MKVTRDWLTRQYASILLLVGAFALCAGCGHQARPQREPVAVKVERVGTARAIDTGLRYSGSVKPYRQVDLAFKNAGYVDRLLQVPHAIGPSSDVQVGDFVKRGTILAAIQEKDYLARVAQARAQLESASSAVVQAEGRMSEARAGVLQAQAGVAQATAGRDQAMAQIRQANATLQEARAGRLQANLNYDRARALIATDSMTATDFDAARASHQANDAKEYEALASIRGAQAQDVTARERIQQARGQFDAARAGVREAEGQLTSAQAGQRAAQAQLDQAELVLEDCRIRAPFDGLVIARTVEEGALVGSGSVAFTIGDTRWVKVTFAVPDLEVDRLRLGTSLSVHIEALEGMAFNGRISAISPAADVKSRVFEVDVSLPNKTQRIRAGMIATLDVPGAAHGKDVMAVPLSAIVPSKLRANAYDVFVVERKGGQTVAHRRDVIVGSVIGNQMSVTSGLSATDEVIVKGAELISDGDEVHVVP